MYCENATITEWTKCDAPRQEGKEEKTCGAQRLQQGTDAARIGVVSAENVESVTAVSHCR